MRARGTRASPRGHRDAPGKRPPGAWLPFFVLHLVVLQTNQGPGPDRRPSGAGRLGSQGACRRAEGRPAAGAGPSWEDGWAPGGAAKTPHRPPGGRELALQRHLASGGELQPEGDPEPRKKLRTLTSDPRWQMLYFQHVPDLGTLHSPAGETGGREVSLYLPPSLTKVISLLKGTHTGRSDLLAGESTPTPLEKRQPGPHARKGRRRSWGAESHSG